jgi:hypothetical protein
MIVLACIAIFGPAIRYDFVSWDDNFNIVNNDRLLRGSIAYFWEHAYFRFYTPVCYTVWSALARLGPSPEPGIFHAANLGLHIFNGWQVFRILRHLLQSSSDAANAPAISWAAAAGAALFCVHPLQVETVAWVSGMRDVLSAAFALAAVRVYLSSSTVWRAYGAAALYVLAALAKFSIVMLPLGLLIVEVGWLGHNYKHALRRLLPFLIAAIPITLIAIGVQPASEQTHWEPALPSRPLIAIDSLGFYLSKLFWPAHLAVDYGRTPRWVMDSSAYFGTGLTLTIFVVALAVFTRRDGRKVMVGAGFALAALAPVLGFVPFDFQAISSVADRYMYLPLFGIALTLAYFIARRPFVLVLLATSIVLTFAAGRALARVGIWENDRALFTAWIHDNPRSRQGYDGLGAIAYAEKDFPKAEVLYRKALSVRSDPVPLGNLGHALNEQHKYQQVIAEVEPALQDREFLEQNRTRAGHLVGVFVAVGFAHEALGQVAESYAFYCRGVSLAPSDGWLAQHLKHARELLGLAPGAEDQCLRPKP